jgi:hypothetical protein
VSNISECATSKSTYNPENASSGKLPKLNKTLSNFKDYLPDARYWNGSIGIFANWADFSLENSLLKFYT